MHRAMDAPSSLGEQPVKNQSWPAAFYFVLFVILGSFLIVNMFIGVSVVTFSKVSLVVVAVACML